MTLGAAQAASDDVAAILAALPIDVAARLAARMDVEIRRRVRDRAVRDLRQRHAGLTRTAAAKAIAADLVVAQAAGDVAAQRVISLNGGRLLAWRQLAEILDNWRGW